MSVASDFKAHMKLTLSITNLIGSGNQARIFDRRGKQRGKTPWILYFAGGGVVEQTIAGIAGAASTILHVWCYGSDTDEADTLDEAVRSALVGSTGIDGRGKMGSTDVIHIDISGPFWDEDPSQVNEDQYEPFVRRVYTIYHLEAVT